MMNEGGFLGRILLLGYAGEHDAADLGTFELVIGI